MIRKIYNLNFSLKKRTLFLFWATSLVITLGHGQIKSNIKPLPQVNKEFQIVAHIVLKPDSTPSVTEAEISNVLSSVNIHFTPIGISFKVCKINYIPNFRYDTLVTSGGRKIEMTNHFSEYGPINIYYIDEIKHNFPVCGFATLGGILFRLNGIVIKCNNTTTVAHELGHFFGLSHTFEKRNGLELVNGSNCTTAGDGICDTPADPYTEGGSGYIDSNCIFINKDKDANGDYYMPHVANIMSYYSCSCPSNFTRGQLRRMAETFLFSPIAW